MIDEPGVVNPRRPSEARGCAGLNDLLACDEHVQLTTISRRVLLLGWAPGYTSLAGGLFIGLWP